MRWGWSRALALGLLATLAACVAQGVFWRPFAVSGSTPADGLVRLAGAVHVHTTQSDGALDPRSIIQAASEAGLDFLVLTDHNNLEAKPLEGYHGRLLVIVGTEVSTNAGHVLGIGLRAPSFRFSGDVEDAFDDIRDLGGAPFVAHPAHTRPELSWSAWDVAGSWGLELVNGDSLWRRASRLRLLRAAVLYPLNPRYALITGMAAPDPELHRWDELLERRDVPGLAGLDAHGRLFPDHERLGQLPSYTASFGVIRTHVLLERPLSGEADADIPHVVEALARGRAYLALDALAPASDFFFRLDGDGKGWNMGETAPPEQARVFRAGGRLVAGAELKLLRDGRAAGESRDSLEVAVAGPGAYRVEVRVPGWSLPWILSNPIYVYDAASLARRAEAAAWPEPATAPAASALLDSFDASSRFAAEFDPTSACAYATALTGSEHRSSVARLDFQLGVPTPQRPNVWCGAVDRQNRDLAGRKGLALDIKADGVYRVWVAVWDDNPLSADDGIEWWTASLKTSPVWRRVALPFARFRSINPKSDGRLDLDQLRGLVFNIDRGAVAPGTMGTLWLDELGVF